MASFAAVSLTRAAPRILPPPIASIIAAHHMAAPPSPSEPLRIPNPFLSHKNPTTGRWIQPQISRRRQANLAKMYPKEYSLLPPGPKTKVSAGYPTSTVLNGEHASESITIIWEGDVTEKVAKVGAGRPYGMRKRFKGHKHEREAKGRKDDIKERLDGMEDRIESWKKTKTENKLNTKPSLPF